MTKRLQQAFAQLATLPEDVQLAAIEAILCSIEERRQLEEFDAFEREASIATARLPTPI